jgi:hypothetical protein
LEVGEDWESKKVSNLRGPAIELIIGGCHLYPKYPCLVRLGCYGPEMREGEEMYEDKVCGTPDTFTNMYARHVTWLQPCQTQRTSILIFS